MTIRGTLPNLIKALDGLKYTPATNFTGSDSLSIQITDTNDGLSASASTALTVGASSPPTVSGPSNATMNENVAFTFSSASGNAITFSDNSLPAGGFDQVALTVAHGSLLLGSPGSIALIAGANNSPSMTIKGTIPNLITALNGLKYTPASNFVGSDTLAVKITDTGDGLSASQSIALSVGVSTPPTVTAPSNATTNENAAFTFSSANGNAITFTDNSLPAGGFDQVALTVAHGNLLLGSPGSIALIAGANNSPSMTIRGTIPNLITALNGLKYTPVTNFSGSDTLAIQITNTGDGLSGSASVALSVGVNSAPTVTAPSNATTNENVAFTFSSANGDAITFTDNSLPAGGFDQVALTVAHGNLLLGSPGSISVIAGANNSPSMTIKGTLPNLIAALNGLKYTPVSNFVGSDTLTVQIANTGDGLSGSASVAISVATSSPPTVSAPSNAAVNENVAFTFSSANGNAITFTDNSLPAGGFDQVALSVAHGNLLLGSPGSISVIAGANNSASMTIKGTLPNLITALNGLKYTPVTNFVGSDTLTVQITNTGDGLSASASVALNVATSFPPTVSAPSNATVSENGTFTFSSANGDAITFTDNSLPAGGFDNVALTVAHGTLLLGSPGSIALVAGANNSASMTIRGTLPNLITALNGLRYTPVSNFVGSDTLALKITNTGDGLSGSASVALGVATSSPPTVSAPANETVSENAAFTFSSADGDAITFTDSSLPAGGFDTVALTVAHGNLLLGSPGSIALVAGANNSPSMTIKGTLPNLIKALDGLSYTPTTNFVGSDSLSIQIANASDGLSASASVAFTVQTAPAGNPAVTTSTTMPDTTRADQSNWMGVAPALEVLNS